MSIACRRPNLVSVAWREERKLESRSGDVQQPASDAMVVHESSERKSRPAWLAHQRATTGRHAGRLTRVLGLMLARRTYWPKLQLSSRRSGLSPVGQDPYLSS